MWKLEDILDLNHLSQSDDLAADDLHQRDREIYLRAERDDLPHSTHIELLHTWLHARRSAMPKSHGGEMHSGFIARSLASLKAVLFALGLIIGAGSGLSYFVYTGQTPLNVFTFFTIFILPQLFLVALLLGRSAFIKLSRKPLSSAMSILLPLFSTLLTSINRRHFKATEHNILERANYIVNLNDNPILFYPFFLGVQLFGVALNLGLIAITAFKVATADLAFGWQTTLQLGAEKLFSLVKIVALPWSWLLPSEIAYPSLAHIEGSRIILKEGMIHLATENLISWWPFLLMSLVIYGLLPRLILASAAVFIEKRATYRFLNSIRLRCITERMQIPLVTTQAEPLELNSKVTEDEQIPPSSRQNEKPAFKDGALLLLPVDLRLEPDSETTQQFLQSKGYTIENTLIIFQDYSSDQEFLRSLSNQSTPIMVAIEAWMAPITEQLNFIHSICAANTNKLPMVILLLGKPKSAKLIEPPRQQDFKLWQDKIDQQCRDVIYLIPQLIVE